MSPSAKHTGTPTNEIVTRPDCHYGTFADTSTPHPKSKMPHNPYCENECWSDRVIVAPTDGIHVAVYHANDGLVTAKDAASPPHDVTA